MGDRLGIAGVVGFFFSFFPPSKARKLTMIRAYLVYFELLEKVVVSFLSLVELRVQ